MHSVKVSKKQQWEIVTLFFSVVILTFFTPSLSCACLRVIASHDTEAVDVSVNYLWDLVRMRYSDRQDEVTRWQKIFLAYITGLHRLVSLFLKCDLPRGQKGLKRRSLKIYLLPLLWLNEVAQMKMKAVCHWRGMPFLCVSLSHKWCRGFRGLFQNQIPRDKEIWVVM